MSYINITKTNYCLPLVFSLFTATNSSVTRHLPCLPLFVFWHVFFLIWVFQTKQNAIFFKGVKGQQKSFVRQPVAYCESDPYDRFFELLEIQMFKSVISIWSDNSIVDICKISLCASREESWRSFPRFTVKEQREDQNKEIAKKKFSKFW